MAKGAPRQIDREIITPHHQIERKHVAALAECFPTVTFDHTSVRAQQGDAPAHSHVHTGLGDDSTRSSYMARSTIGLGYLAGQENLSAIDCTQKAQNGLFGAPADRGGTSSLEAPTSKRSHETRRGYLKMKQIII